MLLMLMCERDRKHVIKNSNSRVIPFELSQSGDDIKHQLLGVAIGFVPVNRWSSKFNYRTLNKREV